MTPFLILLLVAAAFGTSPPRCKKGYELTCADQCGRTCDDYYNPRTEECPGIACITTSCVCDPKQGYYYNKKNQCVHYSKCPKPKPPTCQPPKPECPVGQVKVCDTYCNRTCEDYYNPKETCPQIWCITTNCMCDPSQGYYYDSSLQNCVYYTECPKPIPDYYY